MTGILKKFAIAILPAFLVFVLDQASKVLIADIGKLELGYRNDLAPNFFAFVHWQNTGAAWGMGEGHPVLLGVVSLVVLVLMVLFFRTLTEGHRLQEFAFGLVLGGVAGNLLDRFVRGAVVDFLYFYHDRFSWPAFNVADSGITVGVTLYVTSVLWHSWKAAKAGQEPAK